MNYENSKLFEIDGRCHYRLDVPLDFESPPVL